VKAVPAGIFTGPTTAAGAPAGWIATRAASSFGAKLSFASG
jgi:hypothetical protein